MNLTQVLATIESHTDGLSLEVPEDWMQGRSGYGGLQAAFAAEAMKPLADGLPIRTLQATLIEPVAGRLDARARLIRDSRNTRHVEVRLVQGDRTAALFIGIFGRPRPSVVVHNAPRRIQPDKAQDWPWMAGVAPAFLQHFEVCQLKGHVPGSGTRDTEQLYRVSLVDDSVTSDLAQVLALADFPPPLGLTWANEFKPGSTMTWMLNFSGAPVSGHSLRDWEFEVVLDDARDGYTHQTVSLYAPDGSLVLRGIQCMVVFV